MGSDLPALIDTIVVLFMVLGLISFLMSWQTKDAEYNFWSMDLFGGVHLKDHILQTKG